MSRVQPGESQVELGTQIPLGDEHFLCFGVPRKLCSDRDPSYEADLFQFVMKKMGVKKLRTIGYYPQSNGLTEQSVSMAKNYLTAFTSKNPQNWDNFYRDFAYNTSVYSSTGFTPAHLFYGRIFNVPLNVVCESIEISDRYHLFEQAKSFANIL